MPVANEVEVSLGAAKEALCENKTSAAKDAAKISFFSVVSVIITSGTSRCTDRSGLKNLIIIFRSGGVLAKDIK